MPNYTKKAFSGAVISLIFGALAAAVAYGTRIILARNLTPGELGLFYSVYTLVIFLLFFRDLGLPTALVKYIAEFKALEKYQLIKTAIASSLIIQLISSFVLSLILFLLADYLAANFFHDPRSKIILYLMIIYIFSSIFFLLIKSVLQGFQEMFWYSSLEFLKNSLVAIITIVFFILNYSLLAPAIGWALVCPIIILLYLPLVLKKYRFFSYKIAEFRPVTKQLMLFGLPVLATVLAGDFISYIDTIILTGSRSLEEVGIYNVILPSALIFTFLGRAVSSLILPLSSEFWARNDHRRLKEGIRLLHKYLLLLIGPIIIFAIIFSGFFIDLFFGQQYVSGTAAMNILLLGVLFYTIASINNIVLSGIGKPKTVAKIIIIAAIVNTVLNLIFIPRWGIIAAAVTTAVSYIIMYALSTFSVNRSIHLEFSVKEFIKIVLSMAVFFLLSKAIVNTLYLNPWMEMFLSFSIALVTYIIFAASVGLFNFNEIKYYWKVLRK